MGSEHDFRTAEPAGDFGNAAHSTVATCTRNFVGVSLNARASTSERDDVGAISSTVLH